MIFIIVTSLSFALFQDVELLSLVIGCRMITSSVPRICLCYSSLQFMQYCMVPRVYIYYLPVIWLPLMLSYNIIVVVSHMVTILSIGYVCHVLHQIISLLPNHYVLQYLMLCVMCQSQYQCVQQLSLVHLYYYYLSYHYQVYPFINHVYSILMVSILSISLVILTIP